ncbi:glycine cleavage system aminomethyltransferase GcvT [Proteinivorax hydrogeniformans]|uniref:Aminomethyltransferase n=1 Tax=Proteinivorax hydrogeniformans TaxID=1826727 RepID=A0AAU8HRW2_9FIRM
MEQGKKTPLHQQHIDLGGKMVNFFGWELPVQYSGIIDEVNSVRNAAGIFDVSHMGEFMVEGEGSLDFLQHMLTNNVAKIKENGVQYTMMCNDQGGVVDDLLVYFLAENKYLLVVNASNLEKDFNWLDEHKPENVKLTNISDQIAQIALQGPKAQKVLQKLTDFDLGEIKFFRHRENLNIDGHEVLVSRTGYTGEDGFEIYGTHKAISSLWDRILSVGEKEVVPAGLGSRDTLRFEARLPLYGNEITEEISPIEAGLGFAVKFKKPEYKGMKVLAEHKQNPPRKTVGFKMKGKGIPRSQYKVLNQNEEELGFVTTGAFSPTLDETIGTALVSDTNLDIGDEILIAVRKRRIPAEIISLPFLKKEDK